jgi:hypothetical protein
METCCDSCDWKARCGFMAQYGPASVADLVLMPHALLPHQQDLLPGKPYIMFVDEDFLDALIFELPKVSNKKDEKEDNFRFEVDDLLMAETAASKYIVDFERLQQFRGDLQDCLRLQIEAGELGGVQKKFLSEEHKGCLYPKRQRLQHGALS